MDQAPADTSDLRAYVKSRKSERITELSLVGGCSLHLFADCVVDLKQNMSMPLAGVTASVEQSGGVAARATLSRSLAPGMRGWQKKIDTRELAIVIDGPEGQWVVVVPAGQTLFLRAVRQFAAAVNTAARRVEG